MYFGYFGIILGGILTTLRDPSTKLPIIWLFIPNGTKKIYLFQIE